MEIQIDIEKILAVSQQYDIWNFGNKILYDLCADYPKHNDKEVAVAKLWLIGRSCAAAIERRKSKQDENDDFYENIAAPLITDSELDEKLSAITEYTRITDNNVREILEINKYLVDMFFKITEFEKRSLASKYLHFHCPNLFFIYDSRAEKGLRNILPRYKYKGPEIEGNYDKAYMKFFCKIFKLQVHIENNKGKLLTPRELDRVLVRSFGYEAG